MEDPIVIVDALRTATGVLSGSLCDITSSDLGATVIRALVTRNKINPQEISEVIMGQVLTAACGQNPARQASIKSGVPYEVPAYTINQVCGSGLRSIMLGAQSIMTGESNIVIAGGQESMSKSVHAVYMRQAIKMGNSALVDTMITDGLWDVFNNYHMGITAENVAKKWNISRKDQDEFALNSQMKASQADKEGKFIEEIVPVEVTVKKETKLFTKDETIRPDTNIEGLTKLRPAFDKEGTVTAGNASGINDGAAAVVLMRRSEAEKRGLKIMAQIASMAQAGVDPAIMGIGPVYASKLALQKAGWDHRQLDLIEANEAFASQSLAVLKETAWDMSKVNVNGGAIALGHPIGASGTRITTTLLHEMNRRNSKKALATLCIGGGMGVAICFER